MDIAYAIEGLLPAAKYQGSTTANTQAAYDALVWMDARPKPVWSDIVTYWGSDACKLKISVLSFDEIVFQTGLADAVVSGKFSTPTLRSEFAALNTYATNSDFLGMKGYIQWLISIGSAQAGDYTAVNNVTKAQGVDLDAVS